MNEIFNRREQTAKRRALRNQMPPAERFLWAKLRNESLGTKFRRQVSVEAYVLDFYSPTLRLAIEVDGLTHIGDEAAAYDAVRQREIEALGIEFLRFSNEEVYKQREGVVEAIAAKVKVRKLAMGLELNPIGGSGSNPLWASPISPSERGRTSDTAENSTLMSTDTQNSKQNSSPTNIKPTKNKSVLPLSEGEMGEAQRGFNSK